MKPRLALVPFSGSQRCRSDKKERPVQRILLHPNELYRVPPSYRQVSARRGIAHISHGGKDFVVQTGESLSFEGDDDIALVSPLRSESLVLELFE
jgi:hypothetical protein